MKRIRESAKGVNKTNNDAVSTIQFIYLTVNLALILITTVSLKQTTLEVLKMNIKKDIECDTLIYRDSMT